MLFSIFVLIVAIFISIISAYYSIIGLTAIFAAAFWPIVIMGSALELGKITAVTWMHRYWNKADWKIKIYFIPAIIILMLITSMGAYGYLSKAHMDQTLPSGDVAAKVQLIEEKINTQKEYIKSERDNIASSRAALTQMDAQVTARLERGTTENSAERAVQIRRQQTRERTALNNEINAAQKRIELYNKNIEALNIEKAPLAASYRKIEAEVGPVKYIAALIYGDNPDTATLERAVRWVIILLIFVFDPLALMLVIAAISSYRWDEEVKKVTEDTKPTTVPEIEPKAGDMEMTADGAIKITEQEVPVKKKLVDLKQKLSSQLNWSHWYQKLKQLLSRQK